MVFGILSLWKLFEQDIFWQLRAGKELWETRAFPTVESWSFSSNGRPWFNHQWLTTLGFHAVHSLFGVDGLIVLRGALVGVWTLLLGLTIGSVVPRQRSGILLLLLPLVYIASSFRLHLRADLIVFCLCSALVWLWHTERSSLFKRIGSVAVVLVSANIHPGTALMVVAMAGFFMLHDRVCWARQMAWLAGTGAAYFATPYGLAVFPFVWTHLFYYRYANEASSDFQRLAWRHMNPAEFGWIGLAWIALLVLGVASYLWLWRRRCLPPTYRHPALFLVGCAGLLLLCIRSVRAIPYQLIFLLPVAAVFLAVFWERWRPRWGRARMPLVMASLGAVWLALLPSHVNLFWHDWGFGLQPRTYPTGSVRFIREQAPQTNVYHTWEYGNYLTWALPEYPVLADTRETPYRHLEPILFGAYDSPRLTRQVFEQYKINTVLVPIPETRHVPGTGFVDALRYFAPPESWALVYFDDISIVMLRRIPEHSKIIEEYEYRLLRPNLLPTHYVYFADRTPADDQLFAQEIDRCRLLEDRNIFCRIAQAVWWFETGSRSMARKLLEETVRLAPDEVRVREALDFVTRGAP